MPRLDAHTLRAQPLGVLRLVVGDEPAGRRDHPVPGQGGVALAITRPTARAASGRPTHSATRP